ncbi:MAG: insulinase family protein [Spirochaetia bacterium]|nr:insulinase family protein [Spirochaetia bacterium]
MESGKLERLNINGTRLIYSRNSSYLTSIQFLTGVGSSAESADTQGLAHILEHMFFKGSKKRPGGTAITRAANDIGGKMNAYTSYDHTAYYVTVLNEHFEEAMDILADMYLNPLFPPDEFAKELNPILSEFREAEDDSETYLMERALRQYLGDTYHPILGTEASIKSASADSMHQFHQRYYGGSNVLVCVTGGVEQARVTKAIETLFPPGVKKETPPVRPSTHAKGEMNLTKAGIQEAAYLMFYPSLPVRHPDRYKQDMMSYLLGGNDSSLLFERIREELGMSCYGVDAFTRRYDAFSFLTIAAGIAPDEVPQLHTEVMTQVDRICASKLDEDRLTRAKASIRTSFAAQTETSGGLNSMIGLPILKGETEHPVEKALKAYEEITTDDVLKMAQETFSGPSFKAVLLPEE